MLNELEEFKAYTTPVKYEVSRKGDTAFLGRLTFESLLNLEGLGRILTILARGYLPDINRARNALCAWCSIPDSKNATPKEEWQNKTDFRHLHDAFPELVDENGAGWFYRHVHSVARFVLDHPDAVRKGYTECAEAIQSKFNKMWRDKVLQFQTPIFSLNTKGAWTLRFDDILADALDQGALKNYEVTIPDKLRQRVEKLSSKKAVPYICDLIAYYHAHREEDCDWVVLPVTNFDMYYGGSYFSKRILPTIPKEILERQNHMGVCRYRIMDSFLPLKKTLLFSVNPLFYCMRRLRMEIKQAVVFCQKQYSIVASFSPRSKQLVSEVISPLFYKKFSGRATSSFCNLEKNYYRTLDKDWNNIAVPRQSAVPAPRNLSDLLEDL